MSPYYTRACPSAALRIGVPTLTVCDIRGPISSPTSSPPSPGPSPSSRDSDFSSLLLPPQRVTTCCSLHREGSPSVTAVPNLSGTGDGFRGDNFSGPGWGVAVGDGVEMIQAHYSYPALYFYYYYIVTYNEIIIQLTIMLTGGGALAVILAMGRGYKYRRSFAGSPAAHLLLYGPLPNRPRTGTGPWPGGWGPLLCNTEKHLSS